MLARLAALKPTTLARMHGSAWHGDNCVTRLRKPHKTRHRRVKECALAEATHGRSNQADNADYRRGDGLGAHSLQPFSVDDRF